MTRTIPFMFLVPTLFCLILGCSSNEPRNEPVAVEIKGQTMGTFWTVKTFTNSNHFGSRELNHLVQETLDSVDAAMSTYKPDSDISRFNKSESTEWFEVSEETAKVVEEALLVSKQTEGAFDITVGPLVDLWRFGPDKTPLTAIPNETDIAKIREYTGYDKLEVQFTPKPAIRKKIPQLHIDLSAIAKGFAVDQVALALLENGNSSFMIDVGGEVRCQGEKPRMPGRPKSPWVLGIESPALEKTAEPIIHRTALLNNISLATSGDYRNYNEINHIRFSHLLNPKTGMPCDMIFPNAPARKERLGSVSVFVSSCSRADALATAMFVLGPEHGLKLANDLDLPVLFLIRNEEKPNSPLREVASEAFERIDSSIIHRK